MSYEIVNYRGTATEDAEITSLLTTVFVEGGYTERSSAEKAFCPDELRKRGEIILAMSPAHKLVGMIICVCPTSPARQIAELDEAEIQLLAVHPQARGHGIAANLFELVSNAPSRSDISKLFFQLSQGCTLLTTYMTGSAIEEIHRGIGPESPAAAISSMKS